MSMNNSNQQNLCKQGCGFYGTAQNMDMCSKCYQDFQKTSNNGPNLHSLSNQISINEVCLQNKTANAHINHNKTDSDLIQFALTSENRKRSAQSESETILKVPKIRENDLINPQNIDLSFSETLDIASKSPQNDTNKDGSASPGSSQGNFKKPRRCQFCRRKVGLTGFDCRCGGHYCSVHRYSDKHSCSFDYQAHGQEQIKNQNPMIVGTKIKKI